MKKKYQTPVIEKITFDYHVQTASSQCFGSIMNVKTTISECGDGTPSYIGWNDKHPGEF